MKGSAAPSPRRVIILGSTGSIGTNTLEVLDHLNCAGDRCRFDIVGLAAGRNSALLAEQAARTGASHVACADPDDRSVLESIPHVEVGADAALRLVKAVAREGDLVVGAIVGAAGLDATLLAIELGCDIALANKETLVAGGAIVMPLASERGVSLLPVDSEHSAIAQCLRSGRAPEEVRRLVLTASGGPFRTWSRDRIAEATVEEALDHPTWSMGRKITIDSASMMNKALEVIEAHWLFGLGADQIEVIIHPQSIVHSFVEFVDGSIIAQLGPPDMRTPIQCALTWPDRVDGCSRSLDWTTLSQLDFEQVDSARFPAIGLAHDAIRAGGTAGATLNAANEAAVIAFLAGEIPFGMIVELVRDALAAASCSDAVPDVAAVRAADQAARDVVRRKIDGGARRTDTLPERAAH